MTFTILTLKMVLATKSAFNETPLFIRFVWTILKTIANFIQGYTFTAIVTCYKMKMIRFVFFLIKFWVIIAGVFYNAKNRSSFITSKSSSKNLSNKNTGAFIVFKTKRELKCQFSGITEILWRTFWRNKCRSVFDVVKDSSYRVLRISVRLQKVFSSLWSSANKVKLDCL